MAIREIVKQGDPVLRKVSRPVTEFNEKLHVLMDDMFDTMYKAEGCGLAAPQVGILRKVIVVDCGDNGGKVEMVNPEIISSSGETGMNEGCLSVPGKSGYVLRAYKIKVSYQTRYGEKKTETFKDFIARALQHEIDHLHGILYIDKATEARKD